MVKLNSPQVVSWPEGREGYVAYKDDSGLIKFYYEFGGGDCVTIMHIPSAADWVQSTGRSLESRQDILLFTANELLQTQVRNGRFEIADETIKFFIDSGTTQPITPSTEIPLENPKLKEAIQKDEQLQKKIRILSIALFAVSLTQKCYCTTSNCGDSIMVLLIGWLGMFSGGATFTWLANPLLIGAWYFLNKNLKTAMFLSAGAGLLSMSFLMFGQIIDSEAGHSNQIISYNAGYWLWLSSAWVMLIGTYYLQYRKNARRFIR